MDNLRLRGREDFHRNLFYFNYLEQQNYHLEKFRFDRKESL